MITFEHTETYGWVAAIRGMRNPLNSWAKSDTVFTSYGKPCVIGTNDYELMKKLRNAGTDHRKYLRMIQVSVDIVAPIYWWKEFDTYKVGTVANSCSTMHKVMAKEFTLNDFSCEHMILADRTKFEGDVIDFLNDLRYAYLNYDSMQKELELQGYTEGKKQIWYTLIQYLPSSYNQKRTVVLNYEVLANMCKVGSRRDHKLDEWRVGFMDWVKSLPYSELILGE